MNQPASDLSKPDYDRTRLRPRLFHLGLGAFAKAHVLVFHDEMLRQTGSDWGVVAARLHSGAKDLTLLDEASGLFAVGEMSGEDLALRQVGAILKTLHPQRDGMATLLAQIADPELAVITLTITEKGYCLKNGDLDLDHDGIRQDLSSPDTPTTAIGLIAQGLRLRQAAGLPGLTILSCDNLPSNGHLCQKAVSSYAAQLDPVLAKWIAETCRFPSSMVDRITPAMTEASHHQLSEALGHPDPNGILCEPFRQWVVEDAFAGDKPAWDLAGAEFVEDVAPYEELKLRLLNGSHSFLAYLGALAGFDTIAECMNSPVLKASARRLMLDEQAPTLKVPAGVDVNRYADALIARYANTALHHKTTQIASDGSQKLPQRLLASVCNHLQAGRSWPLTALAIAGWMHYCRGHTEDGTALPLNDPLADQIAALAARSEGRDFVDGILSLHEVFDADLPETPGFAETIHSAYELLQAHGVLASLSEIN
ncbi:mannitol dehydrogenase family protein [Labrenzia sp. VG12]|uniref:mannitol dehydrogenase family protein n=1 Tax=Labrenzia sp. VG12 TaxID=2021862 RepID=UPI000B8BC58C|nr:mannitol dehydrogenase family protein [Labrenzia sp. VG12]ASP34704.1 fructuronate reductase [Labrenzia sp. VG12]